MREQVDLNKEIPAFNARPPDNEAAAALYWEQREAMRCIVPQGSVAQGRRNCYREGVHCELVVIPADHPLLQRTNRHAQRVFRDAHPLDDLPDRLFDNGNGYRIYLGDYGIKGHARTLSEGLPAVRTFDVLRQPAEGAVLHGYGRYTVHVNHPVLFRSGVEPSANRPPTLPAMDKALTVAIYNIENLYDFRDDPFDPEDFYASSHNNPPQLQNYVPTSEKQYRDKLKGLTKQIIGSLNVPISSPTLALM